MKLFWIALTWTRGNFSSWDEHHLHFNHSKINFTYYYKLAESAYNAKTRDDQFALRFMFLDDVMLRKYVANLYLPPEQAAGPASRISPYDELHMVGELIKTDHSYVIEKPFRIFGRLFASLSSCDDPAEISNFTDNSIAVFIRKNSR